VIIILPQLLQLLLLLLLPLLLVFSLGVTALSWPGPPHSRVF